MFLDGKLSMRPEVTPLTGSGNDRPCSGVDDLGAVTWAGGGNLLEVDARVLGPGGHGVADQCPDALVCAGAEQTSSANGWVMMLC